jgi:hypothetical protein
VKSKVATDVEFEFLRVLRGPFFASFAVKGSCCRQKSKDFDREGREEIREVRKETRPAQRSSKSVDEDSVPGAE